jgi:TetR/AcrR family transcriptional repressor of nem operon
LSIKDKDRKGCFVINCTSEYLPKHRHIISELIDNKNNFQNLITDTLQRGKDRKEFPSSLDVNSSAAYLFSLFSGLQITAKVAPDQKQLFKSIDLGLKVLN